MSVKEETFKLVDAILSSTRFDIDVKRFRKEYRCVTGSEFPIKEILDGSLVSDESPDALLMEALEKLGFSFEKRSVPIGDDIEEVLLLVSPSRDKKSESSRIRPNAPTRGRKGNAKPKSKKKSRFDDHFKKAPPPKAIPRTSVENDAFEGDCPFVLKQTATHCFDLASIVSDLGAERRDEPVRGRMKMATRIQFSEYPPETMTATFLSPVAKYFADDRSSYEDRAVELPNRIHLRVTHVEEDGFRFWGRPLFQANANYKGVETRGEYFEQMDASRVETVQLMLDIFVDSENTDGYGESFGVVIPNRPVVVFHGGRWHRGWSMKVDGHDGDVMSRVFLIDEGRVVIEEAERVFPWESNGSLRLPLALPFFLKGCQRQNRGPSFVRQQLLGEVVVAAKCNISLTEYTGKCVTPLVILNWRDAENDDIGEIHDSDRDDASTDADNDDEERRKQVVSSVDASGTEVEENMDEEEEDDDKRGEQGGEKDDQGRDDDGIDESEIRNSFNYYHGEATMETKLPEDAVHRSLMARMAQFGLDPFDAMRHVAQRNVKILDAYREKDDKRREEGGEKDD